MANKHEQVSMYKLKVAVRQQMRVFLAWCRHPEDELVRRQKDSVMWPMEMKMQAYQVMLTSEQNCLEGAVRIASFLGAYDIGEGTKMSRKAMERVMRALAGLEGKARLLMPGLGGPAVGGKT